MTKTLEQCWIEYRDACCPDGLGNVQESETRQAFYSGVFLALSTHMQNSATKSPEDCVVAAVDMYHEARNECYARARELMQGYDVGGE